MRAGRDRRQQVDLGEELEVIAGFRRAWFHVVLMRVVGHAGDLEHVEHVVHVFFGETMRCDRADQIRVTAAVELLPGEQLVHVRIAARAQQIMATGAIAVVAVADRVGDHGRHRTHVRQARPEPIEHAHVRTVQLLGARRPETLARVVQAPQVEVDHLRPFGQLQSADLARLHHPGAARADRHAKSLAQRAAGGRIAERTIDILGYGQR